MGHNIYSFDNTILAFALPKNYPYIKFFRGMSKSYTNTAPSMGLMMNIQGINNLDTLLYIRTSTFGTFAQFSLDSLAKELKLPMLKGSTKIYYLRWNGLAVHGLPCDLRAMQEARPDKSNSGSMLRSRALIEDVLLYNTGAMATSCVCFHALESQYMYN